MSSVKSLGVAEFFFSIKGENPSGKDIVRGFTSSSPPFKKFFKFTLLFLTYTRTHSWTTSNVQKVWTQNNFWHLHLASHAYTCHRRTNNFSDWTMKNGRSRFEFENATYTIFNQPKSYVASSSSWRHMVTWQDTNHRSLTTASQRTAKRE